MKEREYYTGVTMKGGRFACAKCGRWDNTLEYNWSRGDFSYEERRCICGAQITVLRIPEEARHA